METPPPGTEAHFIRMQQKQYDEMMRRRGEELAAQNIPLMPPRKVLLQEAINITAGDRNVAYGNPEDNFQNIADYWNTYLTQRVGGATVGVRLTSQDVAHMMILMKMARLATNPGHRDSLVDIAGYAACGEDCRVKNSAKGSPPDPHPRYLVDPVTKAVQQMGYGVTRNQ